MTPALIRASADIAACYEAETPPLLEIRETAITIIGSNGAETNADKAILQAIYLADYLGHHTKLPWTPIPKVLNSYIHSYGIQGSSSRMQGCRY